MDNAQIIRDAVREKAQIITGLNRSVWEYAELGYQETKSAAAIIKALEDDGFTVTKELAGIPTAFKAVWGSGSPVVGILGEYDALPGLSQKARNRRACAGRGPYHWPRLRPLRPGSRSCGSRHGRKGVSGAEQKARHSGIFRLSRRGAGLRKGLYGQGPLLRRS